MAQPLPLPKTKPASITFDDSVLSAFGKAALQYAQLGFAVFPLRPRGKEPLLSKKSGGNGVYDATTDHTQVAGWWRKYPEANIGVAMGQASGGVFALDIDPRNDGDASLAELIKKHGELPQTATAVTGGGGQHILFRGEVQCGKPHTMKRNIDTAVKLYSGDKAMGLFAERLPLNLKRMNATFADITAIFDAAGIEDFMKLPDNLAERAAFAKSFQEFNRILEAAKIQGFTWEKTVYKFDDPVKTVELALTQHQYLTLLQRYKELGIVGPSGGGDIPFEIDSHITEIDTGKIDADYMNARFEKYLKVLQNGDEHAKETTLAELHRSFSSLSQEEQKFADIFLHDIQRGDVQIDPDRTFRDYLTDYKVKAKNKEVEAIVQILGIDGKKLTALMNTNITEANLNEYGRFDDLKATVDQQKAKAYFEGLEGKALPLFRVNIKAATLLKKFILSDGFELEAPNHSS